MLDPPLLQTAQVCKSASGWASRPHGFRLRPQLCLQSQVEATLHDCQGGLDQSVHLHEGVLQSPGAWEVQSVSRCSLIRNAATVALQTGQLTNLEAARPLAERARMFVLLRFC